MNTAKVQFSNKRFYLLTLVNMAIVINIGKKAAKDISAGISETEFFNE